MQFGGLKTDIAFKKCLCDEQHKEILIGFLNAVFDLQGEKRLRALTLKNPFNAFESAHYLTRHQILHLETLQQELRNFEFNFIEPANCWPLALGLNLSRRPPA